MKPTRDVIDLLADGRFHPAGELSEALRVSREDVRRQILALHEVGLEIAADPDLGFRLARPIVLLDAHAISAALTRQCQQSLDRLDVFRSLQSTNAWLMGQAFPDTGRVTVCMTEYQSAGRGRHGRSWIAPFGSGLMMSLAWTFERQPAQLPALSLAMGTAVQEALSTLGFSGIRLKWPNDLVYEGAKLGGILAEVRGARDAPVETVVGLGLNVSLPDAARAQICAAGTDSVGDLAGIQAETRPDRNRIAAAVISAMGEVFPRFATSGLATFLPRWRAADALADRPVVVLAAECRRDGIARGIDADGALRVEIAGRVQSFVAGEVSLRRAP